MRTPYRDAEIDSALVALQTAARAEVLAARQAAAAAQHWLLRAVWLDLADELDLAVRRATAALTEYRAARAEQLARGAVLA